MKDKVKVEKSAGTFCQARQFSKAEKLTEPEPVLIIRNVSPFPSWATLFSLSFLFTRGSLQLSFILPSSAPPFTQWLLLPLRSPGLSPPSPMRRPTRPASPRPRRSMLLLKRSWYV